VDAGMVKKLSTFYPCGTLFVSETRLSLTSDRVIKYKYIYELHGK